MARRAAAPLGRTQVLVLRLLANGAKSAQHMEYDWPGLTAGAAREAVMRLARRGLADLAGWDDSGHRTYCLTAAGVAAERALLHTDDGEEEVEA